jgi:ABC-2 type transport system permease protein
MMNAVYVMWIRQLKRYWRSKPRLLVSLGQPMFFLLALGFGLNPIFEKAGAGDYISFLVPGVISMSIMHISMFTGIEVVWDKKFGFLRETLVAPIPRSHIMLGRTLGGATISVLQGIIVLGLTILVGFRPDSAFSIFPALAVIFLLSIFLTAFGTALATRMDDMHAFPMVMNFIIMPMFFLSGAIYPLEGIPSAMKALVIINPLTYAVDGLRAALTGQSYFPLIFDMGILALLSVIVTSIGTYLFSKIEA